MECYQVKFEDGKLPKLCIACWTHFCRWCLRFNICRWRITPTIVRRITLRSRLWHGKSIFMVHNYLGQFYLNKSQNCEENNDQNLGELHDDESFWGRKWDGSFSINLDECGHSCGLKHFNVIICIQWLLNNGYIIVKNLIEVSVCHWVSLSYWVSKYGKIRNGRSKQWQMYQSHECRSLNKIVIFLLKETTL